MSKSHYTVDSISIILRFLDREGYDNGTEQVYLDPSPSCFLVEKSLQGQGVGKRLMSALPGAAWDGGMDSLRLACLEHNGNGHRFWETLGFRDLRKGEALSGQADAVWIMERLAVPDEGQ